MSSVDDCHRICCFFTNLGLIEWVRDSIPASQERVARSWLDFHANAFENNAS